MRSSAILLLSLAASLAGCEFLDEVFDDGGIMDRVAVCSSACQKIGECSSQVTPPSPSWFGYSEQGGSGSDVVDCYAACSDPDTARVNGYSDCQLKCIKSSATGCGDINDCWKTRSAQYKKYCSRGDREDVVPVQYDGGVEIDNDTISGSEEADSVLDDDAIHDSIVDNDFPVNPGNNPPIIAGRYRAVGTIDNSSNARSAGSVIDTTLCFFSQTRLTSGSELHYCEDGVSGQGSAPITGEGSHFTIYLSDYPGATILFSGDVQDDTTIPNAEALVTYTYTTGVWEHSNTKWERIGDCTGCN